MSKKQQSEAESHAPKPQAQNALNESADHVSDAFFMLLARLTPEARAAFLLHEIFGADYGEVAAAIGRSQAACRRLVNLAKTQLRDERPAFAGSREARLSVLQAFAHTLPHSDVAAIEAWLDRT